MIDERHGSPGALGASGDVGGHVGAPHVLRILQLYPKADYFTGAAIQLRELARGLAARGRSPFSRASSVRARAWC